MQLSRFVYLSRARIPFGPAEITHLRDSAESVNIAHGVTGLLLYNGLRFAQLVEGPPDGLTFVVERITRDKRHDELQIIEHGSTDRRQFDGWALKVCWRLHVTESEAFLAEVKRHTLHCSEPRVQALFIGFCRHAVWNT